VDPDLKRLCRQTCYRATRTGTSSSGDATYDTPVSFLAHVELETEKIDGSKSTTHRVYTETALIVGTHRVWMPGANPATASASRELSFVEEIPDEDGSIDHYEAVV
jgi:hypothetical protein